MLRNLFAPRLIWELRWELWLRHDWHSVFTVKVRWHRPVVYGTISTKPYWEYVNYIKSPYGMHRRVIGIVEQMKDSRGVPKLNDVMSFAKEQASEILNAAYAEFETRSQERIG